MSHPTVADPSHHPAPSTVTHADHTPKHWTITTREGPKITGYLPDWATENPSCTDIRLNELLFVLADILHWTTYPGVPLLIASTRHHATATRPGTIEPDDMIFTTTIECRPYAPDPHERIPTASFHLTEDCWMTGLDTDALTRLATRLRAQADRLDHEVRPALTAARTDWATHHPLAHHTVAAPPGGTP